MSKPNEYRFIEFYVGVDPRERMSFSGYRKKLMEGRAYKIVSQDDTLHILWNDESNRNVVVETLSEDELMLLSGRSEKLIWILNTFTPAAVAGGNVNPLDMRESLIQVDLSELVDAEPRATPIEMRELEDEICLLDVTPKDRLQNEHAMDIYLAILYSPTEKYKFRNRAVDVGGVTILVTSFHYPLSNIEARTSSVRREYVDEAEHVMLFSYELKAVVCRRTKQVTLF